MNDLSSLYKDTGVLKNQLTMNSVLLSRFFFFCFLSAFFVSYWSVWIDFFFLSLDTNATPFIKVQHMFIALFFFMVKMFQCFPSAQRFEFVTSHKIFYAIRSGFGILTQHPSYRLLNKKFVAARSS